VTNALIGFLFINTYNLIVKPKRFLWINLIISN
jgi:hypothetical protein